MPSNCLEPEEFVLTGTNPIKVWRDVRLPNQEMVGVDNYKIFWKCRKSKGGSFLSTNHKIFTSYRVFWCCNLLLLLVINGSWNNRRICSEPQLDRHLKDLLMAGLVFRFFYNVLQVGFCNYRVIVSSEKLKIDIHNESVIMYSGGKVISVISSCFILNVKT